MILRHVVQPEWQLNPACAGNDSDSAHRGCFMDEPQRNASFCLTVLCGVTKG